VIWDSPLDYKVTAIFLFFFPSPPNLWDLVKKEFWFKIFNWI
jgi:hypothetical protein